MEPLAKEEYIEQAYLFRGLNNRLDLSLIHISEPTRPY